MSTSADLQPTWFISAASGSNRNTGIDSAHPIRDCEERRRRVGREPIKQPTTITYMDSPAVADVEIFNRAIIGVGGSLTLQGTRTVAATGTLTGFTPFSRGAQTKNIIAATGLSGGFAAHVGRHMRITSGARADTAWIVTKDLGGGSAEVSTTGTTTVPASGAGLGTLARNATPVAIGDAFEIVTMPSLACGTMYFVAGSQQKASTGFNRVVIQDLELDFGNKASGVHNDTVSGIATDFLPALVVRCRLDTACVRSHTMRFFQCHFTGYTIVFGGAIATYFGGSHVAPIEIEAGGWARLDYDELFQGGAIHVSRGGYAEIGTACVFDKSSAAVTINPGGTLLCSPLFDPGPVAQLWGTGNTGRGIAIDPGGRLHYYAGAGGNKPTVNAGLGLGREVLMGNATIGSDFVYADVPAEARAAIFGEAF